MKKDLYDILAHDTCIYGIGINDSEYELYFDIDVINHCVNHEDGYSYELFPATIVFKNVRDVSLDISTHEHIDVDHIEVVYCGIPKNSEYIQAFAEYEVTIDCLQGLISFKTIGGYLIQKGNAIVAENVYIGISSKRPISFSLEGEIIQFEMQS